jgi:hypothetical protein
MTMTGRCTSRVRSKGATPQIPAAPSLRPGFGAIVGVLADTGGALPHYQILAGVPGDPPNAPHAAATADSLGGFVFDALPAGTYRLRVKPFAHRPDSATVDVVAGRVDTVRIMARYFECVG